MSEIALKDYLQYHKNERILPVDLFNPKTNGKVARWLLNVRIPQLLRHYEEMVIVASVLQGYNIGCKAYSQGRSNGS